MQSQYTLIKTTTYMISCWIIQYVLYSVTDQENFISGGPLTALEGTRSGHASALSP